MARSKKGREHRKSKKRVVKIKSKKYLKSYWKKLGRRTSLLKKIHGLLKAQGSVLSTMSKNFVRRKEAIIAILPSHTKLSSDVVTISNQKIGEGTFGIVSIGHVKTFNSFCAVKEGKYFRHFNAIFQERVLKFSRLWIFPLRFRCIWQKVSDGVNYMQR